MKYLPALTISALFILSACGVTTTNPSNETADTNIGTYDPCDLLTTTDVQELFPNDTVTLDQHDTQANPIGMKVCFYSASSEDQSFAQLAITSVADAPAGIVNANSLKPLYDSELEFLEPANIQEVAGLGAAAYYGGSGLKPGAGLHVLDNTHGVKLDITVGLGFGNDDQAAHLNMEKSIAEKALSRL